MPEGIRGYDRLGLQPGEVPEVAADALTGNQRLADPVCHLSPDHGALAPALRAAEATPPPLIYRRIGRSIVALEP